MECDIERALDREEGILDLVSHIIRELFQLGSL
jgi:hypothetical protein